MSEGVLFPLMTIGGLPSMPELTALTQQGVHTLINVSGVDMIELYGKTAMQCFQIYSFSFRDVFTLQGQDDHTIWQSFLLGEYSNFLQAVDCLSGTLLHNQLVHCFCQQGISRSSTLVAASLIVDFAIQPEAAMAVVSTKNPRAVFTHRSKQLLNKLARQGFQYAQ